MLTIVEGSQIDRLPIEILSVEKGFFAKSDLIWARGTGPIMAHSGAAQGMSGSPVYVDGRLIGALAYVLPYSKDPLFGVTPIAQMLAVWDHDMTVGPRSRRPRTRQMGFAPFVAPSGQVDVGRRRDSTEFDAVPPGVIRDFPSLDRSRSAQMQQLQVPVAMRGVAVGAMEALGSLFRGGALRPLASVGGGGGVDVDAPVTPGSTIGVEYIRGDISMYAFGTVTYRDGGRILAFGHPAFGRGDSYLPLSSGFVHFLVADQIMSYKNGSPSRVVGTLTQDREAAIAGVIGDEHPPFLPLVVTVTSGDDAAREYTYEVMRHPLYSGGLARTAVWSTLDSAEKTGGDHTVRTKATVTFDAESGHKPLVKTNVMSGTFAPGLAASTALSSVSSILNNWYDEIPIERIDLDVEFGDARQAAAITSARITKQRVRPGDSVDVAVTFRPYLDEPVVKSYSVAIPPDAPEGFTMAFVGDENSYLSWERTRATKKYQPSNAEQLLELLAQGGGGDRLMISLVSSKMGVAVAAFAFLPYCQSMGANVTADSFTAGMRPGLIALLTLLG
ncbi:MAG TPA: hypothetical protein EYQ27_18025, partial [Gemmatimonadetes bacterium]|nr:hypothetical protein [Gemmatimonadota bacterium]